MPNELSPDIPPVFIAPRKPRPLAKPTDIRECASWAAFIAGFALLLWLLSSHPFLTLFGVGVLLTIVSIVTDTGNSPYSGTTPSPTPSEPDLARRERLVHEREVANSALAGLILGLVLGHWFFRDD